VVWRVARDNGCGVGARGGRDDACAVEYVDCGECGDECHGGDGGGDEYVSGELGGGVSDAGTGTEMVGLEVGVVA
jgi:hypothetical protein